MGKCKRVLRCYHCGAILQDKKPNEIGYVDPEAFNRATPIQIIYCDKCFLSMKAFNNSVLDQAVDNEIIKILDDAVATDAIIIWVIDLFSFNGTLNPEIVNKIKKLKVVVIGTKRDLFPKNIKNECFVNYLKETFVSVGITPYSIAVFGNNEKINGKDIISKMYNFRNGHDVFMIGNEASGKTSLINRLLKDYKNTSKREVRTSSYIGTNTKVMEIPLSNSSFFYELPGISQTTSVLGRVEKEIHKFITPKKEIKINTRQLTSGDALMVGSIAAFEIVKGRSLPYKFYSSESVELKKVSSKKLDDYIKDNNIRKSLRPVSDRLISFLDYDMFEYTMENDGKYHDIGIEGLGWLSFEGKGQLIRVRLPKGVALKECLAKVR